MKEKIEKYFYCICDQACLRFNLLHTVYHVQGPKTFMRLLLWWIFDEVLKPFCFVFPPFTDKVVFSYYASWVMFFTRPWSHLTWIFQWSFRVTAESRKLADKLHTMNSCFQILHRSVDAKGSTQCIFVENWYPKQALRFLKSSQLEKSASVIVSVPKNQPRFRISYCFLIG